MGATTTEVSISSGDNAHIRHIKRSDGTLVEISSWHDHQFVMQVIDKETALAVNNQKVVLSREEFKVLREHVNDPDVIKIFA